MQSLINLSIVLNTIDVKLIGRSFSTKFVGPFFWIGVLDHMERHNLFTTDQHGFIKGKSCATQLIEVLDNWTEQLDNRNAIDILLHTL
jgi:hypothetical protein